MNTQQHMDRLGIAIDNVLVAAHGLGHSLADDHVPFDQSMEVGLERYGGGPLFNLWNALRMLHRLRQVWCGVELVAAQPPGPVLEAASLPTDVIA